MVLEIGIVWLLFSGNRNVRMTVLAILILFHLYSIIYVGYLYPTIALLMVLALFYFDDKSEMNDLPNGRYWIGGAILSVFVFIHAIPFAIEGNARLTGEGNRYGMYMFETNYQCDAQAVLYFNDGSTRDERSETFFSNRRCDPYAYWFFFKNTFCTEDNLDRVSWTHDVSLNGGPFVRIVDEPDACSLSYNSINHNKWIVPHEDKARVIRPSAPNRYPGTSI